jgi:hypothetical protein
MRELDEIIDSTVIPNPDNPLHVEAMLALLGGDETEPEDARAVCEQARREGRSFRALARLWERAIEYHVERDSRRLDRFLRRAFGEE